MPCPVAHPGLCAEEDAEFLPFIRAATNILRSVIVRWPPTSVGMLWTSGEGVAHSEKFFSKSHFRHAGPKVALLTKCDMFADGSVELRSGDDGFVDCVDLSLVGEFFQETRSVDFRLYVGRLNLDDAFFCTNGAKRRIRLVEGDGFDIVPTMLHPVQKPVTAKRSSEFGAGLKKMDAALHSCEQRTHIGGVKLCYPRARPGAESDEGEFAFSSSGSSASFSSSSSSNEDNSEHKKDYAKRGAREKWIDGEQFYELWPTILGEKVWHGYSIVCTHHLDCTRDLTWGKRDPMSPDEARRRLLLWRDDGVNVASKGDHKALGGQLLVGYQ